MAKDMGQVKGISFVVKDLVFAISSKAPIQNFARIIILAIEFLFDLVSI